MVKDEFDKVQEERKPVIERIIIESVEVKLEEAIKLKLRPTPIYTDSVSQTEEVKSKSSVKPVSKGVKSLSKRKKSIPASNNDESIR